MDKITLTLETDTIRNIILMIEDYIDALYKELYDERKMCISYPKCEALNKHIDRCKTHLNELKVSIPQEIKKGIKK